MEPYQIVLIVIGSILLFIILLILAIEILSYNMFLKHKPKLDIIDNPETQLDLEGIKDQSLQNTIKQYVRDAINEPHEHIYIKSYDGLKLHAALYRFGDNNAPIAICCHGYHGNKFRDFGGGLKILKELKYNVLLIDQRSHYESEGRYLSFGVRETKDLSSWINKVIEIFGNDCSISIQGISMGGAVVLFAASNENLPVNVKCVIADCPYPSPYSIFEYFVERIHIPGCIIKFLSFLTGITFIHTNFGKYNAYKDLKNNKLPILILHGEIDDVVPCKFSKKLKELYPEMIQLETFANAKHGMSYFDDTGRYKRVTKEFLNKYLK